MQQQILGAAEVVDVLVEQIQRVMVLQVDRALSYCVCLVPIQPHSQVA